jgi:hypothetical protein
MIKKLLLMTIAFISTGFTCANIEQPSNINLNDGKQYYELLFKFTPVGNKMFTSHQEIQKNRTGFREFDHLNTLYGGRIATYKKLRLKLLFNAQLLRKRGVSFNDLIDKYRQVKGEGKFWKLETNADIQVSESVRKIWIYLTPQTTELFEGDRRTQLFENHVTKIKNLDELNEIHVGSIAHIFFTGEASNLTLVVEFAHAVSETVLNEYRALKEIAKVEND